MFCYTCSSDCKQCCPRSVDQSPSTHVRVAKRIYRQPPPYCCCQLGDFPGQTSGHWVLLCDLLCYSCHPSWGWCCPPVGCCKGWALCVAWVWSMRCCTWLGFHLKHLLVARWRCLFEVVALTGHNWTGPEIRDKMKRFKIFSEVFTLSKNPTNYYSVIYLTIILIWALRLSQKVSNKNICFVWLIK